MKKTGGKYVKDCLFPIASQKKQSKQFLVFDIESKFEDTQEPGFTRPFLVGLFDPNEVDEGYQEFRDEPHLRSRPWETRHILPGGCIDKLLSVILTKKYSGRIFYAHNGGNFDHLFVLAWLQERREEFGFEVVPIQSSIQVIRVWRIPEDLEESIKERWELLDSIKLLPMGLDKACKTFKLPGKVDFNLSTNENDPQWGIYLKQDCIALATVMTLFHSMVESILGGEVGITTPSTAMKLFRRRFMGKDGCPKKIRRWAHWKGCLGSVNGTCMGCLHEWIRRGYYGGRTEIFTFVGLLLKYYDLNSSYVASMRNLMPIGDRVVEEGKLTWSRHKSSKNPNGRYGGFCECTVFIPTECVVPPLPHRDRETGKLTFPVGQFHGVWSVEELALLEDPFVGGEIRHVVKTVWFKLEPMFREMVDALWKLRDPRLPDFDEGLSAIAKLLGNGIYGKFAMKQERTSIVFAKSVENGKCFLCGEKDPKREIKKGGVCTKCQGSKCAMPDVDGDVWYQSNIVDAPYIIPHVSSHITALSRIALWRYMKMAVQKGGKIFYCDSVTEDRATIVQDSKKQIHILTFSQLWERCVPFKTTSKERGKLQGYKALSSKGWSPIIEIIRHRTGKPTHRITTKEGQTQVTPDHGIMVDDQAIGPEAFCREELAFTKAHVPRANSKKLIDLFQYVKSFVYKRSLKKYEETYRFEADSTHIWITTAWSIERNIKPLLIRRYYREDSLELQALLRLIGAYVSDGSASIPGETTTSRFMLSFCKADLELMQKIHDDLKIISPNAIILGPLWSDTVYVVRNGTIPMTILFAALSGYGHLNKRLPSFCFHLNDDNFSVLLEALEKGDGSRDVAGAFLFTSTSQQLIAGISYLLAQHDIEHMFNYRPAKKAWMLRTRPNGSSRKGRLIRHEKFKPAPSAWVYDLSIEGSHTFVDAIGQVLLHNTDSLITDVELPCSTLLGELKDEYPGEDLAFLAVQPKVYLIEKMRLNEDISRRQEILRCALLNDETVDASTLDISTRELDDGRTIRSAPYALEPYSKTTMKGYPPRMRTKANLEILRAGGTLHWEQLEKVRSLARVGFRRPPKMRAVKKSFQEVYDKRITLKGGDTRAIVLNEPIGGLIEEDENDLREAAQ